MTTETNVNVLCDHYEHEKGPSARAVGEVYFLLSDRHTEPSTNPRCQKHMVEADYDIAIRMFGKTNGRSSISDGSRSSGLTNMSTTKTTGKKGTTTTPATGRKAEASQAPPATQDNGISAIQVDVLRAAIELSGTEGKAVHSPEIVCKLAGIADVEKAIAKWGPRGKVRAAMEALSKAGYVKSAKEGVKYNFTPTDNGRKFLASRVTAGAATTR